MAMSRKHYQAIAGEFLTMVGEKKASKDEASVQTLRDLADNLCVALKQDNINFDRSRFLAACGF